MISFVNPSGGCSTDDFGAPSHVVEDHNLALGEKVSSTINVCYRFVQGQGIIEVGYLKM